MIKIPFFVGCIIGAKLQIINFLNLNVVLIHSFMQNAKAVQCHMESSFFIALKQRCRRPAESQSNPSMGQSKQSTPNYRVTQCVSIMGAFSSNALEGDSPCNPKIYCPCPPCQFIGQWGREKNGDISRYFVPNWELVSPAKILNLGHTSTLE